MPAGLVSSVAQIAASGKTKRPKAGGMLTGLRSPGQREETPDQAAEADEKKKAGGIDPGLWVNLIQSLGPLLNRDGASTQYTQQYRPGINFFSAGRR
jgi:hypothetical protein